MCGLYLVPPSSHVLISFLSLNNTLPPHQMLLVTISNTLATLLNPRDYPLLLIIPVSAPSRVLCEGLPIILLVGSLTRINYNRPIHTLTVLLPYPTVPYRTPTVPLPTVNLRWYCYHYLSLNN